jgi:zinc protease
MRSKLKIVSALLLLGLAGVPSIAFAQASNTQQQVHSIRLPTGIERVTSLEGVTEYRLQNGLRVLIFPDETQRLAIVNITYLVGSRHESYGETGMAHLLEHLLFKGTPKHPTNLWKEFSDRGMIGNGSTSHDRTNYFATFAATDENLAWLLELEADRMVNSFIARKDLDSEMTVVRNEMERGENSPLGILLQRAMATAFEWHSYGRTVIGARADVENVPIERLQAFYRTYYRPDNAVLIVAGKVSEQKVLDLVHKHFSPIAKPEKSLPQFYTAEPPQDGERLVTLRRVGESQLALAGYHTPPGSHPDHAVVELLSVILRDVPAGRLHKALVEPGKATSIGGFILPLRESGYMTFQAATRKDGSLEDMRDTLVRTVEGFAARPATDEEVERARNFALKNVERVLRDARGVGQELSEWAAAGDWRLFFLHRDRIRKVTTADVNRVAATYLKPSNRTQGVFVPEEKPDRATIPAVSDVEVAAMLQHYKGDAAVAAGEAFDATPANIDARTVRSRIGNLRLALLPRKTRGGSVHLRLALQMGDEKSLMNRATAGNVAGAMLTRGTTKRTRQQIEDDLDRLKAHGGVSGSPTVVAASFETIRENLPALMRLIAEVLREPSFPASEFEQLKQQALTSAEGQRREPGAVAGNALSRHISYRPNGHVHYVTTFEEQIAAIKGVTLDDAKAFHRDFYGAGDGQLTIVGDFDPAEMTALVKELFASWKSKMPYERIPTEYRDFPAINASFETPDKANAVFYAYQLLKVRDEDPDYPALMMAGNILAANNESRLKHRLREKEGISYVVSGSLNSGTLDPVGAFSATATYAPQYAGRLEAAFREEVARALKDGFSPQELEGARKGWLESWTVLRSEDGTLASHINNLLFYDRKLAWNAAFEEKVKALTLEEVNRALKKYIDPDRIIIVRAGDFAKAGDIAKAPQEPMSVQK